MQESLESNDIKHLRFALYHPEPNGSLEGVNKTLKEGNQLAKANNVCWKEEMFRRVDAF